MFAITNRDVINIPKCVFLSPNAKVSLGEIRKGISVSQNMLLASQVTPNVQSALTTKNKELCQSHR